MSDAMRARAHSIALLLRVGIPDYLCGSPDILCFCVFSAEGLVVAVVLIAYQQPLEPANVELIPTMALSTIEPS